MRVTYRNMSYALLLVVVACRTAAPPVIRFAPAGTAAQKVRQDVPLSASERAALTPENLQALTQDQVNQIYARLSGGPIPDGPTRGDLFFPRGANGRAQLREVAGPLPPALSHLATLRVERLARSFWRGKVFYRSQGILRNRIDDLTLIKPLIRDEDKIQRLALDGEETWLLFPARVSCGPSRFDAPTKSIIIDYARGHEIDGYREIPDKLAGPERLNILDEMRLVRPGFYLGRVYFGDRFALNFTIVDPSIAAAASTAEPRSEDCDAEADRGVLRNLSR